MNTDPTPKRWLVAATVIQLACVVASGISIAIPLEGLPIPAGALGAALLWLAAYVVAARAWDELPADEGRAWRIVGNVSFIGVVLQLVAMTLLAGLGALLAFIAWRSSKRGQLHEPLVQSALLVAAALPMLAGLGVQWYAHQQVKAGGVGVDARTSAAAGQDALLAAMSACAEPKAQCAGQAEAKARQQIELRSQGGESEIQAAVSVAAPDTYTISVTAARGDLVARSTLLGRLDRPSSVRPSCEPVSGGTKVCGQTSWK